MSLIHSSGNDRLRELKTELADLRRTMGLSDGPALAASIKNAVAPRIEPIWPERNWAWPRKAEPEARRTT